MIVRDIIERSVWSPAMGESKSNPLFTILLSVAKNSTTELLDDAIKSVLVQKVSDFELIVIDDSQSSEIHTLIDRIADRDCRARYVRHPETVGIKAIGLLEGMRAATGEYLLLLNSTGTLTPNSLAELRDIIDRERFLVGCGNIRIVPLNNEERSSEKFLGSEPLSQVYLKSVDFLPETGIVLHKSVPQSVGYIDPHFVLSNCAVLDYWKRLSRSYEIKRLDVTIGTESLDATDNDVEFGTQPDTMLYREWCKISRNSLFSETCIDRYDVRIKRRFSKLAELELTQLEENASKEWWYDTGSVDFESKNPFIAANERHGKTLLIGHDVTASTTMPFGHFEDEFFYPMAFRHLKQEDLTTAQAVILSRSLFDAEAQRVINVSRKLAVPMYYYFDDNFEILGKSFSAYSAYKTPRIREQLKSFKGILVPNKALLDYCVDNRWHENVMLFPPTVGSRQWHDDPPLPTKKPGHLRVVFLGGSHRSSDFKNFVLPAIVSANKTHPIELIVQGDHSIENHEIDGVSIHKLPYEVSYDLTISRLINTEIDIVLHAGSLSENNPYKTPNSLMNAWELDAVAIVSDQEPYLHVEELGIALVAKSDSIKSWTEKILTVAQDTKTVESIKCKLKEHLQAEYSGTVNVETIRSMLSSLSPLSYPTVDKRYRRLLEPNTSQPILQHQSPNPQQKQRTNSRDDILHKGFTRLYSEIFYRVVPNQDNWSGIAFRIGTFNQQAFGDLQIRIYDESSREPLVSKAINLLEIVDNQSVQVNFEPIQSSARRSYRICFSRERRRDMPRIAIYEEVERESALRRILRRLGILRYGRKLACNLNYSSRNQELNPTTQTSLCT
ncbi:MAG: glycosyltransferase [Pirellula sp.]|jgi:glycosyltransferase involved in cell wall biosynthesis|nr:glycosyltransferase [Pirellula sp.]